ncbi:MAG: TetR/AcrR family transcriptional regulator [Actinomycetota bacterium]|nr:TetR/AcrR family transcriptional regulator [Actinomycetota bacterium]
MPAEFSTAGQPGEGLRELRSDARRNRQRVLEAAQEAFATEGLAVPLDEIARRAGVGAGTVYRHFPSKETLFEAVVFDRLQRLVGEARSLASSKEPGEAFFGFLSRMVEEGVAKKDLLDALTGAGIDVDIGNSQVSRDLRGVVGELLASAQRAGAVREDVGVAEVMVILLGTSLAVRHHAKDGGESDRIVAVVCDGLRTSPPR